MQEVQQKEHWDKTRVGEEKEVDITFQSDDPFADMFVDPRNVEDDLVFKMVSLDYDAKCQYDIMNGTGFMIRNTSWADKACLNPNPDGPRSTKFGFPKGDYSSIDNYRCECGMLSGSFLKGNVCPNCKQIVENRDIDLRTTGWISFGKYKVIHPVYYEQLSSSIGSKLFQNIISYEHAYISSGVRRDIHDQYYIKAPGSSKLQKVGPYYSVGMYNFYIHFEEILTHYLKKKNPQRLQYFLNNKHKVFTSVFPVYSTALRPVEVANDSYQFTTVDRYIEPLANCAKHLIGVKEDNFLLDSLLASAQKRIMEYWTTVLSMTNGKHGSIRSMIMGGTFNYTARSVICLDTTLEYDQIDIGYLTAKILYRAEIIKEIMDSEKINIREATNIFYDPSQHDFIWKTMCKMIQHRHPRLALTRNPLINYQGITSSGIRNIIPDETFVLLALPPASLHGFNADEFDVSAHCLIAGNS